ncbi:DNA recombination protein RmuC [Solicola gregarius]|uniref:DNA recombination protein RmuC n=1 Tax=Solicola gregarius TaxID=2908642 RepID=A0AA46YKW7_9ACTN|nr:DNA recombination protein RmuC [Solicola gregarius]UYM06240.1 DNA recombination protein RmuC [Solicola gregarius]
MDVLPLVIVAVLALAAGLAVGVLVGARVLRRTDSDALGRLDLAASATSRAVEPVKESLDRFDARLRSLETSRVQWHAQLREQVESVRQTSELLRRETASLANALRRPQVRGRWGEMHLQRAVEIAGLVEHSDFEQQPTVSAADTVQRPDLVVHLAGGKQVVVDSKVPLDAFLDASEVDDGDERHAHTIRHARQLRAHVDVLAGKAYWRQFDHSPEFVVLFMPGEAFLSQALDAEPTLLEYAAKRHVVLATPTTLIALLRTVAYAWTQDHLADNARELHALARELYERLGTLGTHFDRLGRSLSSAVDSYNKTVASLETRVLVSARRITDFDVGAVELERPRSVDEAVRPLTAAELLDDEPERAAGDAARRVG